MTAFEVNYWIRVLEDRGLSTRALDEESKAALLRLFEMTSVFEAVGDDDRKEFWIRAERGTIEEFREHYDPDADEEELQEAYGYEYPDEVCWYQFMSVHHNFRGEPFYGVFLNGSYILSVGDCNENGWPVNAVDFINWLSEKAEEVAEKCRKGTYNKEVNDLLPDKYKYGRISRKEYWDIYPERRKEYRECFEEKEIERFLELVRQQTEDPQAVVRKPQITARDFYEACAVCYRANELKPRECFWFKESESERQRYGTPTPKELYYTYADGRDNGMMNVPMDDPEAFEEWLENKGPYYAFNGSHPWEIVPAGSLAFSIHLFVHRDRDREGFCFSLSGSQFSTSVETIRMYLALNDAGIPLILNDAKILAARFTETDRIGILPLEKYSFYGATIDGENLRDLVNLSDGDHPDLVARKAVWSPRPELHLRGTNEENKENSLR